MRVLSRAGPRAPAHYEVNKLGDVLFKPGDVLLAGRSRLGVGLWCRVCVVDSDAEVGSEGRKIGGLSSVSLSGISSSSINLVFEILGRKVDVLIRKVELLPANFVIRLLVVVLRQVLVVFSFYFSRL